MTDMQTSSPLLIVRPSILNPVMHFSTQPLTGEMKCPTSHTFALRIPFHLPKCWRHTSTNLHQAFWSLSWVNTWLDLPWMIWSTPYHHTTSLVHRSWPYSLFTVALVHRRQVLPKLHRLAVHRFKALTCPSPLQPVHRASLVLIFSTLITWFHIMSHMQWVPSSHYMSIASSLSHFSSMAHVAHTSVFVRTNHLCIST